MADQILIQHRFTITKDGQTLSDALVMPVAEYNALSPAQIEVLKQERITNFIKAIADAGKAPKPTKQETLDFLDRDLASLEEQRQNILRLKAEVQGGK